MEPSFSKQKHNPIDLIQGFWPGAQTAHITYDPTMTKGDFYVVREAKHDGTMLFTVEMLQKAVVGIAGMRTCFKKNPPEKGIKIIKYTVGPMHHATVFGMVFLPCSDTRKYPGQIERVRMPVNCEYVY